jgi:glycosyltransferase involved in cell wall biosynthesis
MVMLAAGLPRDRFAVEVGVLTRTGPLQEVLDQAQIPVKLFAKSWKLDLPALLRLSRYVREQKFDVVNTWIFAANVYGRIAARLARVPVVVTSEMAVDLWKGRSSLRLDRCLAGWTDCVVGNSDAVVGFYRDAGIPASKLVRIYSGIGPEMAPPDARARLRATLGIESDRVVVLYAGRLAEQKRVSDLLDAIDILQHVEPSVLTLIAGDGPQRKMLESRAKAFTLVESGRVRFLGARDDVPELIAACDIVALPSRYEGLPNIVMEAMRAEKPVVATNAPGTSELVEDAVTGILVPIGVPRALCKALRDLARDAAMRESLGTAGRVRVDQHFGLGPMIDAYAELYESLARRKRGGGD